MNGHYGSFAGAVNPGFAVIPTLRVPLAVWQKMIGYVQACPVEVNGFGYIDRQGDTFILDEVFILEQTATPVGVEVSADALHRHLYEMTRDGINGGRMRFQWHSHVNMEAYFSGTDTGNIDNYAGDWMISLVANKRGEYDIRLDVFHPFRVWTPINVVVELPLDNDVIQACQGEIHDKVRTQGVWRRPKVRPQVVAIPATIEGNSLHLEVSGEG